MSKPIETSVIIIGGSIVGLANALYLASRKIPFVLIERHLGSSPHPRAIGYTHRTIELFRTVGLDKELPLLPPGVGGKPRRVKTKTLNGEWSGESQWTKGAGQGTGGKPHTGPGKGPGGPRGGPPDTSAITPVNATAIAQDSLEPIIRNKAIQLGADLRLGYKMAEWFQDVDGVSVTAANAAGEILSVRGKYLVACDGAGSRIRQGLGIGTSGVGHLRNLSSILFRCPSIDHYLSRGIHQWSIENGDFEAFMVTYSDGRWALMSYDADNNSLDEEGQKALIRKAIGEDSNDIEILAHGEWDLSASIANQFSSGRVFLAGDAAHTLPPSRGGYGANTGIADAHNLAWKLGAVLSGESDASLLETYDQERRPVALVRHDQIFARDDYRDHIVGTEWEKNHKPAAIIDDVAMELGQLYRSTSVVGSEDEGLPDAQTPAEWKGQPGTRAPHIKLTRGEEEMSSLDLFCRGWVIVSKNESWTTFGTSQGLESVVVGRDVKEVDEGSFGDAFGVEGTGVVLVRPDGHIAAKWAADVSADDVSAVYRRVAHLARNT